MVIGRDIAENRVYPSVLDRGLSSIASAEGTELFATTNCCQSLP